MSVKFRKVVNKRKNSSTNGKIYAKAVVSGVVHSAQISEEISKMCTLTPPDVLAVIKALDTNIAGHLQNGERVVLDDFGAFKVGLRTKPADTAKKFTAANVVGMHVIFQSAIEMQQGKRVKTLLKDVKVEELVEYKGLNGSEGGSPSGGSNAGGSSSGGTNAGGSSGSDTTGGTGSDSGTTGSGSEGGGKDTGSEGDNEHIVL